MNRDPYRFSAFAQAARPESVAAGYFGGVADMLVTSLVQLFLCFPPFFLVLAATAFLGQSVGAVIVVMGSLYWVTFARIVRGEILSLRERDFVKCARGLGVSTPRVLMRHVLPAVKGPILVNAAFVGASAIVVEATLSFLGLGPAGVSWGLVLREGKQYAGSGDWHLWVFPCLVMVATVFCLHSLADIGIRSERATSNSQRTM